MTRQYTTAKFYIAACLTAVMFIPAIAAAQQQAPHRTLGTAPQCASVLAPPRFADARRFASLSREQVKAAMSRHSDRFARGVELQTMMACLTATVRAQD